MVVYGYTNEVTMTIFGDDKLRINEGSQNSTTWDFHVSAQIEDNRINELHCVLLVVVQYTFSRPKFLDARIE